MVVDSIKKLVFYFINSAELQKNKITMNTAIVPNDDSQSLYEIVENCLKDNVSMRFFLLENILH